MKSKWWLLTALLLALSLVLVGCGSDDDDDNGTNPVEPNDKEAADLKVDEANDMLADIMFDLVNNNPEHPSDVNMTEAYELYEDAVLADADHAVGNFGMGMLEVVMLTGDDETLDFFDTMSDYFEGDAWFLEEDGGPGAAFANPGALGKSSVSMPLTAPVAMMGNMTRFNAEYGYQIGDMQQFVRDMLIPKIQQAIGHLEIVLLDETFTFVVTPEMQGDPGEDAVELDLTEVYAVLVAMNSLEALLQQFVAYDWDMGQYSGDDMLDAFTQTSSFGALTADGADRMKKALGCWVAAGESISDGLAFLEGETDPQQDDLIRIDPYDGITEAEVDSVRHYLTQIMAAMTGSTTIEIVDSDNQPYELEVSLYNYFNSPVQNLKALVPEYTVSLDLDPAGWPMWDDMTEVVNEYRTVTITVPAADYYSWYRYGVYFRGDSEYEYGSYTVFSQVMEDFYTGIVAEYADYDYADIYVSFGQTLTAGQHDVEVWVNVYTADVPYRYVPVFTWEVDSGEDWILPNPTVGGLFPGMTDAEIKDLLGWTPDDWSKSETWHIWGNWYFPILWEL
ncbi:hypothetical protein KQI52_15255 [bacterium]|nr:hypothetical protein [bacterium]